MIIGIDFDGTCVTHEFPIPKAMNPIMTTIEAISEEINILITSMKALNIKSPEWDKKVSEYNLLNLKIARNYEVMKMI
jgi:hypothetical protein